MVAICDQLLPDGLIGWLISLTVLAVSKSELLNFFADSHNHFTTEYQGRRYSFGYPACPALEDQAGIWKLLKPEEIGVQLTEGFMMDPEASVSALVFHHPDCTYFGVGDIAD